MAFDYLKHTVEGLDKPAVIRELVDAFGKDVWNYAFLLTLRTHDADDVMQDVFVKAFERLDTFRGEAAVKTWLFAIARNTVRDRKRSAWLRRVTLMDLPHVRGGAGEPSAEQEVLSHFLQGEVWREVMRLSPKLREVLLLTAHHGLGNKEIAELLGISEGTVKSRLSRARDKVDRMLKEGERE